MAASTWPRRLFIVLSQSALMRYSSSFACHYYELFSVHRLYFFPYVSVLTFLLYKHPNTYGIIGGAIFRNSLNDTFCQFASNRPKTNLRDVLRQQSVIRSWAFYSYMASFPSPYLRALRQWPNLCIKRFSVVSQNEACSGWDVHLQKVL